MMSRHIRQYVNAALLPSAYFAIIAYIGFFLKAMVRSPFTLFRLIKTFLCVKGPLLLELKV
jgi:multisubunit Na+/H+ antiporter MnhE subunit